MPEPQFDPAGDVMTQLSRVAGLLTAAGTRNPATTDPGVALLCLAAVEDLRRLGVRPERVVIGEVADAVGEVVASLAALPVDVFATTPVLDAAANARAARALLTASPG